MITSTIHAETSFDEMLPALQAHFEGILKQNGPHLFAVETQEDLWGIYLNNLPDEKQQHTCHCCKNFIRRYGNLASVDGNGVLESAIWTSETHSFYAAAFAALARAVKKGKITGVALFKEQIWGTAISGDWTHFAITPPAQILHKHLTLTPGQQEAVKKEDYRTLMHGLADFNKETVAQAATLIEADSLYRSEKVAGPVRFLLQLHEVRESHKGRNRDNLTWLAVAGAPVGFCQPRSTMIGTLLDDIKDGHNFEDVKRRFGAKMHPLQYQRPQAAPRAGNLAQAEKLVAELGLEPALHRRFARLDEIQTLWKPKPTEAPKTGSVFGHLLAHGNRPATPLAMPAQAITWEKFARTVLPGAKHIEIFMEARMNFCATLTAVDPDAPQILQWGNPFSWYVYNGMSTPGNWRLPAYEWVTVTGVALKPSMWEGEDKNQHQGKSALFVLHGAQDLRSSGLALFPEILKSELHSIRATIEAYSNSRELEGREEASANGLLIGEKSSPNKIRVTNDIGTAVYNIDRWD